MVHVIRMCRVWLIEATARPIVRTMSDVSLQPSMQPYYADAGQEATGQLTHRMWNGHFPDDVEQQ